MAENGRIKLPPGFQVAGCPTANNQPECLRGCGGFHRISTPSLTRMVSEGTVPVNICGPINDRVQAALKLLEQYPTIGQSLLAVPTTIQSE